jgi:hypothetical protein
MKEIRTVRQGFWAWLENDDTEKREARAGQRVEPLDGARLMAHFRIVGQSEILVTPEGEFEKNTY